MHIQYVVGWMSGVLEVAVVVVVVHCKHFSSVVFMTTTTTRRHFSHTLYLNENWRKFEGEERSRLVKNFPLRSFKKWFFSTNHYIICFYCLILFSTFFFLFFFFLPCHNTNNVHTSSIQRHFQGRGKWERESIF